MLFAIVVSAGIFGLLIFKQQNDRWLSSASGVETVAASSNALNHTKSGDTTTILRATADASANNVPDNSPPPSSGKRLEAKATAATSHDTLTTENRRCRDALDRGKAFLAERRTGNAIIILRQAIGFDPACAEAHYYLGMALAMHGDKAAARAQRDTLMQLDPNLASLLDNLVR